MELLPWVWCSLFWDTVYIVSNSLYHSTAFNYWAAKYSFEGNFKCCCCNMCKQCSSVQNAVLQDTFDICRKTFSSGDEMQRMALGDKIELFFHDYSLVPLFAYENYIGAIPYSSRCLMFAVVQCSYMQFTLCIAIIAVQLMDTSSLWSAPLPEINKKVQSPIDGPPHLWSGLEGR